MINDENTIAIGMCGIIPDKKGREKLFRAADTICKLMYSGLFTQQIEIKDLLDVAPTLGGIGDFIGVTTNRAFVFRKGVIYPQTGHLSALGTGARSIVGCYYVVQDLCTAFRLSAEIDTLSSANFTTVKTDLLNPYVMG